jgi:hypothetical protein
LEKDGLMSVAETWSNTDPVYGPRETRLWSPRWRVWPTLVQSLAVLPGEAATPDVLQHEKARQALIALVHRFAAYGLSWTAGEAATITPTTEQVSDAFLRGLPARKAFPRISPDGQGGLMMVWEGASDPFLLTVDDLRLHGVVAAGTPHAQYLDDIPFDAAQDIPQRILDCIPAR